jgi:hypothetical protein
MIKQMKSTLAAERLRRIQSAIWNRGFMIAARGAFGLVPANALIGDVITVVYGASISVVLQKLESSHLLVGECYIHRAADGLKSHKVGPTSIRKGCYYKKNGEFKYTYRPSQDCEPSMTISVTKQMSKVNK